MAKFGLRELQETNESERFDGWESAFGGDLQTDHEAIAALKTGAFESPDRDLLGAKYH
jgi:hypothetical protein